MIFKSEVILTKVIYKKFLLQPLWTHLMLKLELAVFLFKNNIILLFYLIPFKTLRI